MTLKTDASGSALLKWTLVIVVILRLATMGLYPLTDTTEARYAEVARKMVELGDWVTPWYEYGVPFWAKPPLSNWVTAASLSIFGVNEFAARLPHFLLALVIAWLVGDWVGRASKRQALLTIALLSGTMLYFVAAAAVMTDMALALGTTLAMRGFWNGLGAGSESPQRQRSHEAWLFFVGLGIGMLAKGPVAVVLAGTPVVLWALLTGNVAQTWKRLPWVKGSLLVLALSAPWYAMAEIRTPGFLEYFFIGEHWMRFTVTGWAGDRYGSAHATQRGAIWLLALAACLPWTLLLPFLLIGRRAARRNADSKADGKSGLVVSIAAASPTSATQNPGRSFKIYLLMWSITPCLFFTASGNILWTYVLPALPALAMLTAYWLACDARARLVDAVLSAGLLTIALLVGGYMLREEHNDSWKTAKTVVAQYQARNTEGLPLLFVSDRPYSASFYTLGKAQRVAEFDALAKRLDQGDAFVALTKPQVSVLPPELQARLKLLMQSGAFDLYRATPAVLPPSTSTPLAPKSAL